MSTLILFFGSGPPWNSMVPCFMGSPPIVTVPVAAGSWSDAVADVFCANSEAVDPIRRSKRCATLQRRRIRVQCEREHTEVGPATDGGAPAIAGGIEIEAHRVASRNTLVRASRVRRRICCRLSQDIAALQKTTSPDGQCSRTLCRTLAMTAVAESDQPMRKRPDGRLRSIAWFVQCTILYCDWIEFWIDLPYLWIFRSAKYCLHESRILSRPNKSSTLEIIKATMAIGKAMIAQTPIPPLELILATINHMPQPARPNPSNAVVPPASANINAVMPFHFPSGGLIRASSDSSRTAVAGVSYGFKCTA